MLGWLSALLEPAKAIAGKIADTVQGKQELIASLATLESGLVAKSLEYEQALNEAQSKIIVAEAQSQSFLTRNWRPMTMLAFVAAVLAYWFGLTPEGHLTEEVVLSLFSLVKIGLGGYVVGRSAEKIATTVAPAIRGMDLRRKKD